MTITIHTRALALCAMAMLFAAWAAAQTRSDLRAQFRDNLSEVKFMSTLSLLSDDLEFSGARFQIDDNTNTDLWSFTIPWRSTSAPFSGGKTRLYSEGAVGYAEIDQGQADVFGGAFPATRTAIDSHWQTFGFVGGAGPQFALSDELSLTPLLEAGISHIENDTDYAGLGASFVRSIADGVYFNFDTTQLIYGGSAVLDWNHRLGERHLLEFSGRWDVRWTETIDSDDHEQDFDERFQILTVRGDLSGPTGFMLAKHPLGWQLTAGYRHFLEGDLFDVDKYTTVGGSLLLRSPQGAPFSKTMALSAYASFGDNFYGWTFAFSVYF